MEEILYQASGEKKHFKYLGYILISFSIVLLVNIMAFKDLNELVSQSFGIVISLIIGIMLIMRGTSKYHIKLTLKSLSYISKSANLEMLIQDISIVKSFQEQNKTSVNLVIFASEDDFISLSSAFIDLALLKELFEKLHNLLIKNENVKFEDDLNWLNLR